MFEQVTLFAAGYLRTFKYQKWRGRRHNILGREGAWRVQTEDEEEMHTGDRLDNDGTCSQVLQLH